jgi:hypothetical protein
MVDHLVTRLRKFSTLPDKNPPACGVLLELEPIPVDPVIEDSSVDALAYRVVAARNS